MQDFLSFNKTCPICQNPLTLFMKWSSYDLSINKLFQAHQMDSNKYQFQEYILDSSIENSTISNRIFKNTKISMILELINNECNFKFNSLIVEKLAKEQEELFFYYLCKPRGIKEENIVNIYESCYYRATPFMKFVSNETSLLKIKQLDDQNANINGLECFAIKDQTTNPEMKKIYIVYLNYLDKKLSLFYYTAAPEQEASENYDPNTFVKEIPLPQNRLNLDINARDKLISRMDSWILMS